MKSIKISAVLLIASLAFSGCGSSVKLDEPAASTIETAAARPESRPACCSSLKPDDPLNDPQSLLSKRSVYFDFNAYAVSDAYRLLIEAHSRYLAAHKNRKVILEGHADERGGREYNIAIGQKRSDAVKKALMLYGVAETQLEAISFGEERPKELGSNEKAWAENRRVDIVYE